MSFQLAKKYVGQAMLLWLGCAFTLFAFAWVRVWVVSLLDMGKFRLILEQFREYERFAPISFDQLFTYSGRVGMTFDEPVVIFCVVVWAIARGSDVVSGELNRGTLEMLLAQPVSRTRLLLTHAMVSTVGLILLVGVMALGMWIGVQTTTVEETAAPPSIEVPWIGLQIPWQSGEPETIQIRMRDEVEFETFLGSFGNLFAFGFFLLALSSMVSAMDRFRWRTIGIVIAIYIIQIVMFGLGKAAEPIDWLTHLSFFDLYRPQGIAEVAREAGQGAAWGFQPFEETLWIGPVVPTILLVSLGLLAYLIALRAFSRRDLPAPL